MEIVLMHLLKTNSILEPFLVNSEQAYTVTSSMCQNIEDIDYTFWECCLIKEVWFDISYYYPSSCKHNLRIYLLVGLNCKN